MLSYEEAVQAQAEIEDKLLENTSVVSVGIAEETNENGIKTGSYIIQVGVLSEEKYQETLEKNQAVIPSQFTFYSKKTREKKQILISLKTEDMAKPLTLSQAEEKMNTEIRHQQIHKAANLSYQPTRDFRNHLEQKKKLLACSFFSIGKRDILFRATKEGWKAVATMPLPIKCATATVAVASAYLIQGIGAGPKKRM